MSDQIYHDLAKVLDTLPNGFPSTEEGVEIKILKKVFAPEDAELFCDLRLQFENAEQIAKRTGRGLEGLDGKLWEMSQKGQLFAIDFGGTKIYKMLPWVFGIYEMQLDRLDREFCELVEDYSEVFGKQFFSNGPQLMQVIPVEKDIKGGHTMLPYEQVSNIVENSKSFRVMECICKKEKNILDDPCDRPTEVCMAFAPIPGVFESGDWTGRSITQKEAYEVLELAEKSGLVHMTWNYQNGHFFICNCCSCCCGVLRSINEMGVPAQKVVNSFYYAVIDEELCTACGTCADERCQVEAIEDGNTYKIIAEKCIGCGLCVSTCPEEAIQMVKKDEKDIELPPENEAAWFEERGKRRGVDFSKYK
jgi:H+/Na+-translocating ferredoxin:NAD+ oxidoreductase subunit B